MNKQIRKPVVGGLILVEYRKCSEKIQPNIQPEQVYLVKAIEKMKNGHLSLTCTRDKKGDKLVKINEDRFYWRCVSKKEVEDRCDAYLAAMKRRIEAKKEQKFREDCKRTVQNIKAKFTESEHLRISIVPMVVAEMAWKYAYKCKRYCADNRISEMKKVGRALVECRHHYEMSIVRDLRISLLNHISEEADKFLQDDELAPTLLKAEFQLANEFYSQYKEIPHLKLKTYAVIGQMLIRAYSRHNEKMTALIRSRIPNKVDADDSLDNVFIVRNLYTYFDALIDEFPLTMTTGTKTIEAIIDKAIKDAQCELKEGESVGMLNANVEIIK